jgi:hypothetical protein
MNVQGGDGCGMDFCCSMKEHFFRKNSALEEGKGGDALSKGIAG